MVEQRTALLWRKFASLASLTTWPLSSPGLSPASVYWWTSSHGLRAWIPELSQTFSCLKWWNMFYSLGIILFNVNSAVQRQERVGAPCLDFTASSEFVICWFCFCETGLIVVTCHKKTHVTAVCCQYCPFLKIFMSFKIIVVFPDASVSTNCWQILSFTYPGKHMFSGPFFSNPLHHQ